MEVGAHVWLRKEDSHWGWVPALITKKEPVTIRNVEMINLTLRDDSNMEVTMPASTLGISSSGYHGAVNSDAFEVVVRVDPEQLKTADHDDIKLRNLPAAFHLSGEDPEAGVIASPSVRNDASIVGGVDDLIGLTHLHEPAILHALRLRYDADIIYTSTGPILIAVNPFKKMDIYSAAIMEKYCLQGEQGTNAGAASSFTTPFKNRNRMISPDRSPAAASTRLAPHVYQTADDAYRAMIRGMENLELMGNSKQMRRSGTAVQVNAPTDQSILVSGESGAGKTVTTKIVLNYFAMVSKRAAAIALGSPNRFPEGSVSIEQQVLQSNPILESFGNARTIRNDNSSRFGKYIDIRFTRSGKLSGASIETYLLEKVRLIHPSPGERNYHVFYQFLSSATAPERQALRLNGKSLTSFKLLSMSGTFDRRDGVSDEENHQEMLEAMVSLRIQLIFLVSICIFLALIFPFFRCQAMIGFDRSTVDSLMRLVIGVLFAGNMTFTASRDGESCSLDRTPDAEACASLLGLTFDGLSSALTSRVILAGEEIVHKPLTLEAATKAAEALIKAVYGAAFDFIVEQVNLSITDDSSNPGTASIGLLDIFGFETFDLNSFEQLCINYTNEALQQQFNKYVFKLEQQEYEKEGIMWKFISFPDNQDVLDLIDKKHTGIMALLDEQCILPKSTDEKFTRYIYARCDKHPRFSATSAQRVDYVFSIEHYAGFVEYNTENWLEKNKDQLPSASAELLKSSTFVLIQKFQRFVRSEDRGGRGTVATKSVSSQFSSQLRTLRARIDITVPHYVRCLKPNDDLAPDYFEPKNVVEQLRCGGVLEAVRVSRAGYPTRYPHEVFLARYYILGDSKDDSPQSPVFSPGSNTGTHMTLKRLIAKIAFDLWNADIQIMRALILAEQEGRDPFGSPKFRRVSGCSSVSHTVFAALTNLFVPIYV
jgi:myosin V